MATEGARTLIGQTKKDKSFFYLNNEINSNQTNPDWHNALT